jgi:hypothetical protein
LSQSHCNALLIDRYALTIGQEMPLSYATDIHPNMVQINFDGDRKKANCLGMPAWIIFKFASPLNYKSAKVTVREQFVTSPDENEYEMTRHR